jgi:hypothetical protein
MFEQPDTGEWRLVEPALIVVGFVSIAFVLLLSEFQWAQSVAGFFAFGILLSSPVVVPGGFGAALVHAIRALRGNRRSAVLALCWAAIAVGFAWICLQALMSV